MDEFHVNPEKMFFDFAGQLPPAHFERVVADPVPDGPSTAPKLITDTTLRDGAQDPRFALFPAEAKLAYFDLLHELDNNTGRIEAVEVFIYQQRDLWAFEKLLERGYAYPIVTTWTRATPKDIKLLVSVAQGRIPETGMLASSSDHHIFDKLSIRSKQEAIERYLRPIVTACEHGIRPRVHLEDVTKADIYGWVIPFMQRVFRETQGVAKFRACDTMGLGVPDPYAALPFGIPQLISTLVRETGAEIEFHGHNDFGLATANTMAALRYGAKRANTTFAGLGERTGNTPLEQVLANYVRVYGNPGFRLEALPALARLINDEVVPIPSKQPIVGSSVFATQAGLHQTGIERQKEAEGGLIYLPFDPKVVGREQVALNLVGSLSGMDGIAAVLNEQIALTTGQAGGFTNASKLVKRIYDAVQKAYDGTYDQGSGNHTSCRKTFFSPAEVLALAQLFGLE